MVYPGDAGDRALIIEELARRIVPSLDFYIFIFLSGLALVAALLFDAPAFYLLAVLVAPFMAPVVGLSLAAIVGSVQFFLRTTGGLFMGGAITFLAGMLAGLLARLFWPDLPYEMALRMAHLSVPNLILLAGGDVLAVYLLVRSPKQKPMVASAALAYGLLLPLGVAGYGLASGRPGLWPDGLLVFAIYLAVAAITGTILLALMHFRPLNAFGYTLTTTLALLAAVAVIGGTGLGTALQTRMALPMGPPTLTATPSKSPTASNTPSPLPATPTPTRTLVPTRTATLTVSPEPTPIYARISSSEGGGAVVREKPAFNAPIVKSLLNGMLVEILPETRTAEGFAWVMVRVETGEEGWILRSLLTTATPRPGG